MPEFWAEAAKIVKPGGTVALWTCASLYCRRYLLTYLLCEDKLNTYVDPSTPNAAEVNKALYHLEQEVLKPYELRPNRLSYNLYDDLPLPWNVDPPVSAFPKSEFVRCEWDRNGVPREGNGFFVGKETTLDDLEKSLSTASMVTRWRAANPILNGTEDDCVKAAMREIRKVLGIHSSETLNVGNSCVLLLFKRR